MVTCKYVNENLFAYVENKLPHELKQPFDKHISECAQCASNVAEFTMVMHVLEKQKQIEPRPFAETHILQAIETHFEKHDNSGNYGFIRLLRPAILSFGLVTAIALGMFIGVNSGNSYPQLPDTEEDLELVRSELNIPEFMTDKHLNLTE